MLPSRSFRNLWKNGRTIEDTISLETRYLKRYFRESLLLLKNLFYSDMKRWSFLFEIDALQSLAKLHVQSLTSPMNILERSIHCTRYCFIEHLHQK